MICWPRIVLYIFMIYIHVYIYITFLFDSFGFRSLQMGGAVDRVGSKPIAVGPEVSLYSGQQAARANPAAAATRGAAALGPAGAAGLGSARGNRDESGGAGNYDGGSSLLSDQAAAACGDPSDEATDLGWMSEEQLGAIGLPSREDVLKSTSMVSELGELGERGRDKP